jgi:hypothetical protein
MPAFKTGDILIDSALTPPLRYIIIEILGDNAVLYSVDGGNVIHHRYSVLGLTCIRAIKRYSF